MRARVIPTLPRPSNSIPLASGSGSGQESPAGVSAALTASYVHTLFYKYAEDEPSAHAANWRFDDEWSNTDGPSTDSWYNTAAGAETNYLLNPDNDNTDDATLWECKGQFRRRLNADGDAYLYNDSKEVFAVWGEEFSEDAESWHGTKTDDDIWQRIRTPLGDWGTPTYIGSPSGVEWEVLHAFQNVYRTTNNSRLQHHRHVNGLDPGRGTAVPDVRPGVRCNQARAGH